MEEEIKLELSDIRCPDWYPKGRKIGRHSRKLNGETFVAPRITLPPDYNDLIGQFYFLFDAKVKLKFDDFWRKRKIEGKAIVLVVPEREGEELKKVDWDDEDWEDGFDE